MIQEAEIILFILATGVLFWVITYQKRIYNLLGCCCLLMAYYALYLGWTFTIVEGFCYPEIMNGLEHLCYTLSMVFVAIWSHKTFIKGKAHV